MKLLYEGDPKPTYLGWWRCSECNRTIELEPNDPKPYAMIYYGSCDELVMDCRNCGHSRRWERPGPVRKLHEPAERGPEGGRFALGVLLLAFLVLFLIVAAFAGVSA